MAVSFASMGGKEAVPRISFWGVLLGVWVREAVACGLKTRGISTPKFNL